jgi:hypothetical protein
MESVRFFEANGFNVVYDVSPVSIDPEKTRSAIAQALDISPDDVSALEDLEGLIGQYAAYPQPGPGELHVSDDEGGGIKSKLAALGERQRLTLEGETIPDWMGTKYHLKTGDTWTEEEIAAIGEALPEGAVLPDNLTAEQRAEIAEQREAERLAALSPEEREAEKQSRLDALADEADRLSRRAQIQGNIFDTVAWYQEHKGPIEEKYAS